MTHVSPPLRQDVVFALAHATGKVGRFTLIERWRNNERHLAPNENPMKLLLKWGEYANDVQFILQRSENKTQQQTAQQQQQQQQQNNNNNNNNNYAVNSTKKPLGPNNSKPAPTLQKQKSNVELSYRSKELKKSFGCVSLTLFNIYCFFFWLNLTLEWGHSILCFKKTNFLCYPTNNLFVSRGYDAKQFDNIGIVRGIPQQQPPPPTSKPPASSSPVVSTDQLPTQENNNLAPLVPKHEKSLSNPLDMTSTGSTPPTAAAGYNDFYNNNNGNQHIYSQLSKSSNELRRSSPNEMYYNNNANVNLNNNNNNNSPEMYKQTPTISANGALVPPPYRDPPPPRNSPMCQGQRMAISNADTMSNASSSTNPFISDYDQHSSQINMNNNNNGSQAMDEGENMFQATQYNDLMQLIKFQREKITSQQMELQKVTFI